MPAPFDLIGSCSVVLGALDRLDLPGTDPLPARDGWQESSVCVAHHYIIMWLASPCIVIPHVPRPSTGGTASPPAIRLTPQSVHRFFFFLPPLCVCCWRCATSCLQPSLLGHRATHVATAPEPPFFWNYFRLHLHSRARPRTQTRTRRGGRDLAASTHCKVTSGP